MAAQSSNPWGGGDHWGLRPIKQGSVWCPSRPLQQYLAPLIHLFADWGPSVYRATHVPGQCMNIIQAGKAPPWTELVQNLVK